MHVLLVPSWYPTTEAPLNGIYFAEQARCLADHGLQVGVIYPEHQSLRRLSWQALQTKQFQTEWTHEYGVPTLRRYGWNVWSRFPPGQRCRVRSAVQLASQYVDRVGVPDVVHAQSGRWAGAAAARIGRRYNIPSVLTEHYSGLSRSDIFPWRWPLIREGYNHAHVITAVSSFLKQALVDQLLAAPSSIQVTPNLAPTNQFGLPSSSRPAPPPFHLVTIARLTPRKNIGGLLNALSQASLPDKTTLRIVGDGPRRSALEARARQLNIRSRVHFLGRLDRPSVQNALWDAHALVLPSRHETFGIVLLEAMATGLPVIASNCGGPADIVSDLTGLLVPPDDETALADGLETLSRHWACYDDDTIRSHVEEHYGPDAFVRRTRALYHRALELME